MPFIRLLPVLAAFMLGTLSSAPGRNFTHELTPSTEKYGVGKDKPSVDSESSKRACAKQRKAASTPSAVLATPPPLPNRFRVFAHRGASGTEPENTMRAFQHALAVGADGIELDVHYIDGQLIVFHDKKLERTTNGHGYLKGKTFAYLRSLDAGEGERIPTLAEVCEQVGKRVQINVELKGTGTGKPVAAYLQQLVQREGRHPEQFVISSFLPTELQQFRHASQIKFPIALLLSKPSKAWLQRAKQIGAGAVNIAMDLASPTFIETAHKSGLKVYIYTVDEPEDLARMKAYGADGIFTNFPERATSLKGNSE